MNCIFCKIRDREVEKEFLFEDSDVMAFYDIHPAKPVHILVIPKRHITDIMFLDDPSLWEKIRKVATDLAKKEGLDTKGFRISINAGGAQFVPHLHVHVLGPVSVTAKL